MDAVIEKQVPEGIFYKAIYSNEKYGTSIALYKAKDDSIFTVTGVMLPTVKNVCYHFNGEWVNNQKYGIQFKASDYSEIVNSDRDSIISYLSSGIIKGIGKVTAARIYDRFGERTMEVFDTDIESLRGIRGITEKKLIKIKESYMENRMAQDVVLTLAKYGIHAKTATKAYTYFKEETKDVIATKSYLLCLIPGITFEVADRISPRDREYEFDYERFKMCARYVLLRNESGFFANITNNFTSGSIGMDKDEFGLVMFRLLRFKDLSKDFVLEKTIQMIKEGELCYKKIDSGNVLMLPGLYNIENAIADDLIRLNRKKNFYSDLDKWIEEAEVYFKIVLSAEQKLAVKSCFQNKLSLIIGPPGTGKTTTIKVIAYIYKRAVSNNMVFLAPSGKAASRIKETTGETAYTVHSGCEIGTEIINDLAQESIKFSNLLVVVDEMSMLDARTAYQLFSSIGSDCTVVLSGDDEQLQSVGAGAVLRDIIDSDVITKTYLNMVYRQGNDTNIYLNAFKMRSGNTDLTYGGDFQFVEIHDTEAMQNAMLQTYINKVAQYGIENVMLISPFKEHAAGVKILNELAQAYVNAPSPSRKEVKALGGIFRIGDRVMQLKNDSETGVVNGDVGVISYITDDGDDYVLTVDYADQKKEYNKSNIEELTLAYASTVHKSQGSEAKCVITCIHSMHSRMLKRNIIYTAITRAKEEVIIFGEMAAMNRAILTQDKEKRYTALKNLLQAKSKLNAG